MESTSKDASKRIPAGKTFKAAAIDEAGDALAALEANAGTLAAKVEVKTSDIVAAHLETILRLQEKGIPLSTIYKELKARVKLRIEYKTFKQYVSREAVNRGISRRTTKATPEAPAVVAEASASPATEQAVPEAPAVDMEKLAADASDMRARSEGWKCPECVNAKHDVYKGKHFFECGSCGTCYAGDADGNMTRELFSA